MTEVEQSQRTGAFMERGKAARTRKDDHHALLEALEQASRAGGRSAAQGNSYLGTTKRCYLLGAGGYGRLARSWLDSHPDMKPAEYLRLFNALSRGESHEEFTLIGILISHLAEVRRAASPRHYVRWLARAEGWGEVDSLCQSAQSAAEMLDRWEEWQQALEELAQKRNVHQRRASLVLLTRPVRESADSRLSKLAFQNIERLSGERDILITKAISWLLRSLIKHHRMQVEAYLATNEATLPRIAVREVRYKLQTGRKAKVRVTRDRNP